jgi:hypothetical protein
LRAAAVLALPAAVLALAAAAGLSSSAAAAPAAADPPRALGAGDAGSGARRAGATGAGTREAEAGPDAHDGAADRPAWRPHADDPGIHQAIHKVLVEARTGEPVEPERGPNGANVKFWYRGFEFACATSVCFYHGVGIMAYPSAWIDLEGGWRILRFGIGLQAAGEDVQQRDTWWKHNFLLEGLLSIGIQYPWTLTPYAELIVGLGAVHRNLYNWDEINFAYSFSLEAGLEWFVYGSFNLSASVGWRRSVVDTGESSRYADSVTFQVGFGF